MIRRMEERDITPLAKLFLQGRRQTFHWVDPSLFHLDDFIEQTRGEEIWVAERGGDCLWIYRRMATRALCASFVRCERLAWSGDWASAARTWSG